MSLLLCFATLWTVPDEFLQLCGHSWPPDRLPGHLSALGNALVSNMDLTEHLIPFSYKEYNYGNPIYTAHAYDVVFSGIASMIRICAHYACGQFLQLLDGNFAHLEPLITTTSYYYIISRNCTASREILNLQHIR